MIAEAEIRLWKSRMGAGRMAADSGSYLQASRQYQLALEIAERNALEPSFVARSLSGLARSYGGLGKNKEAERLLQRAVEIDQVEGSDNIVDLAADRLQLAALLRETGRESEAEQVADMALSSVIDNDDAPTELTAALFRQLAIVYLESGKFHECASILQKGLDRVVNQSELGRHCLAYGQLLIIKVLLFIDQGRLDEARVLFREAMQVIEMERGHNHPRNADLMEVFARHLSNAGQNDLAKLAQQRSGEIRKLQH